MKEKRLSLRVPGDLVERLERVRAVLAAGTKLDITAAIAARRVLEVGLDSVEHELRIGRRRNSARKD